MTEIELPKITRETLKNERPWDTDASSENLPKQDIEQTPIKPENDRDENNASPDNTLTEATPDMKQAPGETVVVTVMASCAVTTSVPILNTTAATASI